MVKDKKTGTILSVSLDNLSNLRWWQATIMICGILLSSAIAAHYGVNVNVNIDLESRIATIEKTLETPVNSSFYALQKEASFIVGKVGSYYTLQNGTTGALVYYNTNVTRVEQYAIGNTTKGMVYLKDLLHNYNLTIPQGVSVKDNVNGSERIYGNVLDSSGSPYTISGDTKVAGYYLWAGCWVPRYYMVQDSSLKYISSWTSTNASSVYQNVFDTINASNKGTVNIKAANYLMDSPLTLMQRGDICAEQGTALLAASTLTSTMLTIPSYSTSSVKTIITNLRFEALNYSAVNVKILGGSTEFNNVEFYGARTYGVWLTSSVHNNFYGCKWGAMNTGTNLFLDGTLTSSTANFNVFRENIFSGIPLHHVLIDGRASQNLFVHNIFEGVATGSTYAVKIRGTGDSGDAPYGNVFENNWFETIFNATTVEDAIVLDASALSYAPQMTRIINNHFGLYHLAYNLLAGNGTKIENSFTSGIASGSFYFSAISGACYNTEIVGGLDEDGLRVSNAGIGTQFHGEGYESSGSASGTTPIQVTHNLKGMPTVVVLGISGYDTYFNMSWSNVNPTTFQISHDKGSSATISWLAYYRPGS